MSSLNPQKPPLLQEVVDQMRDNILRSQSTASTAAITSFDNMVAQMKIFVNQINAHTVEVKRLQELCTKHKIDYSIPPVVVKIPESKIAPPKEEPQKPVKN